MKTIKVTDEAHKKIRIEAARMELNMIQTIEKAIDLLRDHNKKSEKET